MASSWTHNPWLGASRPLTPAPSLRELLEQGLAHHNAGALDKARQCYERALALAPEQADALNLLGVVAALEGRREEAVRLLSRAAASRPKDADILNNLGRFLLEDWRFEEAREPLERAVSLDPDNVNARYNLAGVLRQLGEPEAALALWTEVLAAEPDFRSALVGRVEVLMELGRFEEAEALARDGLTRFPELSPLVLCLARTRRFEADDGVLAGIDARLAAPGLAPLDQANLRYAAGKICDDLGLYDRAAAHFAAAGRTTGQPWDAAAAGRDRRRQTEVFTPAFFRERADWGCAAEAPVFIVGMPRSGTSLVEQMLAAHPEVFGAGEFTAFERLAHGSSELTPGDQAYPLNAPALSRFAAETIGRRYVSALSQRADRPVKRIIDKTPHNFEHLGLIALTLPKARIVHCRRDPLDTCVSCWTTAFNEAHGYNRALADLGSYYVGYQALMDHWRAALPLEVLEVDYEELVRDPEPVARRMLGFLGLSWAPQVLDFHKDARPVRSPSLWQVRQPVYASSIGRWRNYAAHLGSLREALGPYAPAAD